MYSRDHNMRIAKYPTGVTCVFLLPTNVESEDAVLVRQKRCL